MKILFLARALERGGAERQLVELAKGLATREHRVAVAVMYPGGQLERELLECGITVIPLDKRDRWEYVGFVRRLVSVLRDFGPDVLHSYLTVPNIVAAVVRSAIPKAKIVWGVRVSDHDLTHYDWLSRVSFRLTCILARRADRIIVNSQAGRDYHCARGYPAERTVVIPNGIDLQRFSRNEEAGARFRRAWKLPQDAPLVALVARIDPMKDHETFLDAARQLGPAVRFVCAGGPLSSEYGAGLMRRASELGLDGRLVWTGEASDVVPIYSALDVAVSSSAHGEGFSNAVAEAMACGVPCVVTDVGDSRAIVGDTGVVVPRRAPRELARGIEAALQRSKELGALARRRIEERYSIDRLVETTEAALEAV